MKRRGKVLLAIVLVMAMIGTSMGSSNVLSVFAKDVATTPAVEESKEVKRTNTKENSRIEGTNATQEVITTQESQQAARQDTTSEQDTVAEQDTSTATDQETVTAAKQVDIADSITSVDMSAIINGESVNISSSSDIKVPRGAAVCITVGYSNMQQIEEGSILYYQLPEQIKTSAQSGTLTEVEGEDKTTIGSITVSQTGRVEISYTKDYIEKCGGMILSGQFSVTGRFSESCGANGIEVLCFGQQEVTVNFKTEDSSDGTTASDSEETTQDDQGKADPAATTTKEEETSTADKDTTEKEETFGSLTIEKKVVGNNIPEETYNIKVESAEGNNNKDLTKVTVTDTADKKELATIAKVSGTLTFTIKAGQKVELQDLSTGNYSVTEAVDDKASYTASYSEGNTAIAVTQDKTSAVTVTNTYPTELYFLNKDSIADTVLAGAEFAIYKATDVSEAGIVSDGAEAVTSWTSGTVKTDLTGKVKVGESYVLVQTKTAQSDYEKAETVLFAVDEKGQITVGKDSEKYYDDATHTLTVDSKKKTGTLSVKKIIEDGEEGAAFDFTVTFADFNDNHGGDVTITRNGKDTTETVAADGKLALKALTNNETVKIAGIPYGTSYTVSETQKEGYLETENSGLTGVIGDNQAKDEKYIASDANTERVVDAEASITNTKLAGFTVKNSIKNSEQNVSDSKRKRKFDFTVTLTKNNEPYTGEVTLKYSNKKEAEKLSLKDSEMPGVYSGIELADTQSVAFSGLPSGVKYAVEEKTDENYDVSVKVNPDKKAADSKTESENNKAVAEGTINKAGDTIEFTNTRKVGAVSFTNTVEGDSQDEFYKFIVKVDDTEFNGTAQIIKADGTQADKQVTKKDPIELSNGEKAVIGNLPSGLDYKVQIESGTKYVASVDGTVASEKNGTIESEKTAESKFVLSPIRVSIKKTDSSGQQVLAGAKLLLKNKEDKTKVLSWTSEEEAKVFEKVLNVGDTYTLSEVTAPSGYEVAEDITFTVEKDGTVSIDGKSVDNNEVIMKDKEVPDGEEGKLVVNNVVKYGGNSQAVNRTFYVALFSDADCEKRVSDVKELRCEGTWSAYTVFEYLKDGIYYVAVTDEDGNKLDSLNITGSGVKYEISAAKKTVGAVITNNIETPGDDFLNTRHDITVTKNVTIKGKSIPDTFNGTFYASLFTDPYYTYRVDQMTVDLQVEKGQSVSSAFTSLANGTYYVAETDADGNLVENSDFDFDVTYTGNTEVTFNEDNSNTSITITNDMKESHADYEKYLADNSSDSNGDNSNTNDNNSNTEENTSETDYETTEVDEENNTEETTQDNTHTKNTSTKAKTTSSSKKTKKSNSSKTGDTSHISFYIILMVAVIAIGSIILYKRIREEQ